ncbi:MAG: hypothetical protein ABJC79_02665 [Acidimicrobiia bacterium]
MPPDRYLIWVLADWEVIAMNYHEFLTYLFDRDQTRELAVELGVAVDDALHRERALVQIPA